MASWRLGVNLPGGVVDKAGATGDTGKSPALIRLIRREKPVVSAGVRCSQWERRKMTALLAKVEDALGAAEGSARVYELKKTFMKAAKRSGGRWRGEGSTKASSLQSPSGPGGDRVAVPSESVRRPGEVHRAKSRLVG